MRLQALHMTLIPPFTSSSKSGKVQTVNIMHHIYIYMQTNKILHRSNPELKMKV